MEITEAITAAEATTKADKTREKVLLKAVTIHSSEIKLMITEEAAVVADLTTITTETIKKISKM